MDIGTIGIIDYNQELKRLAVMKSLSDIAIIPNLHSNTNKFFGMSNSEHYIAYKVIKDKMIALNEEGLLCSWSVATAKILTRK
jgi:hypothetical protein